MSQLNEIIKEITTRKVVSPRGGGIEISLDRFGYKNEKMSAYQNYLGGGMLGKVASDCTVKDWKSDSELKNIAEELKQYYFNLTNPEEGWESQTYITNQLLPVSAY